MPVVCTYFKQIIFEIASTLLHYNNIPALYINYKSDSRCSGDVVKHINLLLNYCKVSDPNFCDDDKVKLIESSNYRDTNKVCLMR